MTETTLETVDAGDAGAFPAPATITGTPDTLVKTLTTLGADPGQLTTSDADEAAAQNSKYAARASTAIQVHAALTSTGGGVNVRTALGRILADLRHFADQHGIDFDDVNDDAETTHTDELFGG